MLVCLLARLPLCHRCGECVMQVCGFAVNNHQGWISTFAVWSGQACSITQGPAALQDIISRQLL